MNHLGLFSGIGGFEEAFRRVGATLIAACEIDPQAQKVLRRHFPGTRIISDVKAIKKDTFGGSPIDLITGGFPCQDLSVAGRRKGLDGERSGLWFEYLRIIDLFRPRWVEIENVPGLLSSNGGEDFAIILRGLVELGYGVAWRVFDSQFDGVAQRRERVFIVASLGTASCAEVLFEREGGSGNHPPSREAGESVTGTLNARTSAGGGLGTDFECLGGIQVAASFKKRGGFGWTQSDGVTGTLESEGGTHQGGPERVPLIAQTVRQVAQSLTSNYGKQPDNSDTGLGPNLVTSFTQNTRDEVRYINGTGDITGALPAEHGAKQQPYVMAFTERTRAEGRNLETQDELAYALTNPGSGGRTHSRQIAGSFGVRRLTPRECERLQGFPDDWTRYGDDGKEISDSARYRMLGNAVCLPTVEWIARRIMKENAK